MLECDHIDAADDDDNEEDDDNDITIRSSDNGKQKLYDLGYCKTILLLKSIQCHCNILMS